jgi:plasmid stabilization system protein ParE
MTPTNLELLRLAMVEARVAYRWYARRSAAVANRFLASLDQAMLDIAAFPDRWPSHLFGTRAYKLRQFPYLIVYRIRAGYVQVVAVMHGRRRPGYWHRRLS